MRKPFFAGNWKMNMKTSEASALVNTVVKEVGNLIDVEVGVAPPFTVLGVVNAALQSSNVRLMAQNVHWKESGAYTGEISVPLLKDIGVTHVIIGHSERRHIFRETDLEINLKVRACLAKGLIPVLCVGETLQERKEEMTREIVEFQLHSGLMGLNPAKAAGLVIAYEPVWAIGTGLAATPMQAQEVHAFIREWLKKSFSEEFSKSVRLLYGGSVTPENVKHLMNEPDIDGALVGGASLKADSFVKIVRFNG